MLRGYGSQSKTLTASQCLQTDECEAINTEEELEAVSKRLEREAAAEQVDLRPDAATELVRLNFWVFSQMHFTHLLVLSCQPEMRWVGGWPVDCWLQYHSSKALCYSSFKGSHSTHSIWTSCSNDVYMSMVTGHGGSRPQSPAAARGLRLQCQQVRTCNMCISVGYTAGHGAS